MRAATLRVALVGEADDALRDALRDILATLGVEVVLSEHAPADVVLALLVRDEPETLLPRLRGLGRPIVALVAFSDERLCARARQAGAVACHGLDSPFEDLRRVFQALSSGAA